MEAGSATIIYHRCLLTRRSFRSCRDGRKLYWVGLGVGGFEVVVMVWWYDFQGSGEGWLVCMGWQDQI